ncbi:hypothetical protein [Corynebacterium haemomassiliense]|uniref:Uncharacterized protein n=1 Tax=Corynebacterium haemomassiliense TaxID=2754726 RepID=A0A7W2ECL3_9CORY|nr:hypothetical protein [Corynebacterium haemomassiliense]MBA5245243.1 hypothetical protein [Corynebacterium haemomassiliense]
MTDSHPSIFSFTTDIPGTEVEVTVSVKSIYEDEPSPQQIDFARKMTAELSAAVSEYTPVQPWRTESLDAYVVLANTHQLLDLGRDSVDTTPSQARRYFAEAADNLEILKEWDPRFTTAYYQARKCEQAAGNFLMGELEEFHNCLETWMPTRLGGDSPTERVVVVDDLQTQESFAATLTPDHEAVSVNMLDADEVDDYFAVGRTVYPVPMYPDGTVISRLATSVYVDDMRITYLVHTEDEAFPLLKELGETAEEFCSLTCGYTPVEYYTELAYAKQLDNLVYSPRFDEDGVYRRNLLDMYAYSLSVMSNFDEVYEVPRDLARSAAKLNEEMRVDASVELARTIGHWLPRDISELIPRGWTDASNQEFSLALEDGLNLLPGRRFVAVFDHQSPEEYGETCLPNREQLYPFVYGHVAEADIFDLRHAQIFLGDV